MLISTDAEGDEIRVCVPKTDVFQRHRDAVLPLVGAVTFKDADSEQFGARLRFLETSLNLFGVDFPRSFASSAQQLTDTFVSFSCDLGPNCQRWELGESTNGYPRYLPDGKVADLEELTRRAVLNASLVRAHFDGVLKVENLNYFPTGAYELVCQPDIIHQILEAIDAELLLDIGHAIISAHNLGLSPEEYIDQLPLHRVSEVHISRPGLVAGVWEDMHELPGEAEFALLERIAGCAPLRFVTMEYYRNDGFVAGQHLLANWCAMYTRKRRVESL